MPAAQVALAKLNQKLGPGQIENLDADLFAEGKQLSDALPDADTKKKVAFALDALPYGVHDAIRSVLRSAVKRRMPVTLSWAPGYDFKVTIWDVASTDETEGGITVLIETRYPEDAHPLQGTMSMASRKKNTA